MYACTVSSAFSQESADTGISPIPEIVILKI